MTALTVSLSRLAGRTGRGVSVAVVDSGVHRSHPHVGVVQAAAAFDADGLPSELVDDRLGHGTAVAAAIREKAPDAVILSVRVFDRSLTTSAQALVAAIRWATAGGATLINLSLGTANHAHRGALADAVSEATAGGALVVAAAPDEEREWLPGSLDGVIAVGADWDGPRDRCQIRRDGPSLRVRASGLPRPIAGVSPGRNVRGASFAVANASGFLALALEGHSARTADELWILLASIADTV